MKAGNKNDRIDARKLAELLYLNKLDPIYHGEAGVRTLKELARSYLAITRDLTRVMSRLKAIYRSWAIPCAGILVMRRATSQAISKTAEAAQFGIKAPGKRGYRKSWFWYEPPR